MASNRTKKKRNFFSEKRVKEKQNSRHQLIAFTRRFLLASLFAITLLSLIPENFYYPVNRLTAVFSWDVLRAFGFDPVLKGTFISIEYFKVNVISECSAVHLLALLGAFIYAFPSTIKKKLIGFLGGAAFIFSVNVLRISVVTIIGKQAPGMFEIVHIYLGQLIMMLVTVTCCILWCHWTAVSKTGTSPLIFIARFLVFSSLLFLIWLPVNRFYMIIIDTVVSMIFSVFSHPVEIPMGHNYYYQTFSLITLTGLLLAFSNEKLKNRLTWVLYGFVILTVLQVVFRMTNAWISAFNIQWMRAVSQAVYNIIVYAVPVTVGIRLFMQGRAKKAVF